MADAKDIIAVLLIKDLLKRCDPASGFANIYGPVMQQGDTGRVITKILETL